MKRNVLAAAALLAFAGAASASPFGVYDPSLTTGSPSFLEKLADPLYPTIAAPQIAFSPSPGPVTVQFLGHSATYENTLYQISWAGAVFVNNTSNIGDTVVIPNVTSPAIFTLTVDQNSNGILDSNDYTLSTGVDFNQVKLINEQGSTFILGFEDILLPDGDKDYNDMVFRVTVVPEPSTYALMLGGLGVAGWMARRRKRAE
ncbi:DUF4114 domain-containing protein [Aquabacterium sp. J223]|nr:DUF4114 domain-containing protein [Aquabacterium sp. J223]UUX95521.1 DUF4114 domain-containing protein [Aquabacterium sp. J223]